MALLQMAISLLIAAQSPSVPPELKTQATAVANYAITVANEYTKNTTTLHPQTSQTTPPQNQSSSGPIVGGSANNADSPSNQEQILTEGNVIATFIDASTADGLNTAKITFLVTPDVDNVKIVLKPSVQASTTGALSGRGLQYHPKGESSYSLINYPSGESVVLTNSNAPHSFEFYHSYSAPVFSFDYKIEAEIVSYEGENPPALNGFPITGSYDTCKQLSNLYEIRVMCGIE